MCTSYFCADGLRVNVSRRVAVLHALLAPKAVPWNGISYDGNVFSKTPVPTPYVSGVRFDRDLTEVLRSPKGVRTLVLPGTTRKVGREALSE